MSALLSLASLQRLADLTVNTVRGMESLGGEAEGGGGGGGWIHGGEEEEEEDVVVVVMAVMEGGRQEGLL